MVPLQLYTPQIQNGATPPLYPTNPERRHTSAIPHVQEQDFLPPSVHERAFLTPPPCASTIPATQNYDRKAPTFALIYLIHFIHLSQLIHLNHSIHLIQLIHLIHLIYVIHVT